MIEFRVSVEGGKLSGPPLSWSGCDAEYALFIVSRDIEVNNGQGWRQAKRGTTWADVLDWLEDEGLVLQRVGTVFNKPRGWHQFRLRAVRLIAQ